VSNETDDVVMAIKARWARALDLDDETMSVVALERATRKQREAMETAMAADLAHVEAFRRARARADGAEAAGRQDERREFLAWLRAMDRMHPGHTPSRMADEYEKAAAKVDRVRGVDAVDAERLRGKVQA
jgi:hypothetical protein